MSGQAGEPSSAGSPGRQASTRPAGALAGLQSPSPRLPLQEGGAGALSRAARPGALPALVPLGQEDGVDVSVRGPMTLEGATDEAGFTLLRRG